MPARTHAAADYWRLAGALIGSGTGTGQSLPAEIGLQPDAASVARARQLLEGVGAAPGGYALIVPFAGTQYDDQSKQWPGCGDLAQGLLAQGLPVLLCPGHIAAAVQGPPAQPVRPQRLVAIGAAGPAGAGAARIRRLARAGPGAAGPGGVAMNSGMGPAPPSSRAETAGGAHPVSARAATHIGVQFGEIAHIHGGLGEFCRQLGQTLAERATALQAERGWQLHFQLPERFHGLFGPAVHYHALRGGHGVRATHGTPPGGYALFHYLHQHIRLPLPAPAAYMVTTVHDLNYSYVKTGASLWLHDFKTRRRLRDTDLIVAITDHVAADIRHKLGWRQPIRVCHNGSTDLSRAPQEAVPGLQGRPFFFHLSRMAPSKNVEALIGMMAIWPEAQLVLAGPDSEDVARCRREMAGRGLRNIEFHTDVPEAQKAWLLAHCQVLLFPSWTEGFGLPVVEALYFGKPVMLARRTSLPEIGGRWPDIGTISTRTQGAPRCKLILPPPATTTRAAPRPRAFPGPAARSATSTSTGRG